MGFVKKEFKLIIVLKNLINAGNAVPFSLSSSLLILACTTSSSLAVFPTGNLSILTLFR